MGYGYTSMIAYDTGQASVVLREGVPVNSSQTLPIIPRNYAKRIK